MNNETWSKETEEELILLIKDWLKQIGRTQSELCRSLDLPSSRIQALIDYLKKEFALGGIQKIANRLCEIEALWEEDESEKPQEKKTFLTSSGQLDLLDEICNDLSKINFNN